MLRFCHHRGRARRPRRRRRRGKECLAADIADQHGDGEQADEGEDDDDGLKTHLRGGSSSQSAQPGKVVRAETDEVDAVRELTGAQPLDPHHLAVSRQRAVGQ